MSQSALGRFGDGQELKGNHSTNHCANTNSRHHWVFFSLQVRGRNLGVQVCGICVLLYPDSSLTVEYTRP
jgi:hypothetical protein